MSCWADRCCPSSAAWTRQEDEEHPAPAASATRAGAAHCSARPRPEQCRECPTKRNSMQKSPVARAPRRLPERKSGRLKTSVSSNPSSATLRSEEHTSELQSRQYL